MSRVERCKAWARPWCERLLDCIWPHASRQGEQERADLQKRKTRLISELELLKGRDEAEVGDALDGITSLLAAEDARRTSVESKLVAALPVMGFLLAFVAFLLKASASVSGIVLVLAMYVGLQLLCMLLAVRAGLRLRAYLRGESSMFIPEGDETRDARRIRECRAKIEQLSDHADQNNEKGTALRVAHTALRNAAVTALVLLFVVALAGVLVDDPPPSPSAKPPHTVK